MRVPPNRILRELFFWLRPDFVLRVVARFQSIAGFDRAVALASSALTAMIPLTIFVGAVLPTDSSSRTGIDEVKDVFGNRGSTPPPADRPAQNPDDLR